jgi:hypothetical protein
MLRHSEQPSRKSIPVLASLLTAAALLAGCASVSDSDFHTAVSVEDDGWRINGRIVHAGSPAEGLLMNLRMVNTVLEDHGPNAREYLGDFHPDENTDRFIARIPEYRDHGVLAFTVSLQGGHTGYEQVLNSAFNTDGSLRPEYMRRVARVVEACDRNGVVVILTAFYQRQHWHERALAGREALLNAVENMARWVDDRGYTNVVLEISNEYSHGGFRHWNDGEWLRSPEGQVELIRHARAAAPRLLVSTSDGGHGRMHEMIAEVADFILIHFNNTGLEDIPERIETVRTYGKPVVCNEDDKIEDVGAEALRLSVRHGAAWGLMLSRKNQYAPFEYDGAADDPVIYAMMKRLTTPGVSMDAAAPAKLSVVITQPSDGLVFRARGTLTMRASVFGTELDSVREVRFLVKGEAIGGARGAPWSTTWENLSVGSYNLTAVAFGADGEELGRSRRVDIQVIPGD